MNGVVSRTIRPYTKLVWSSTFIWTTEMVLHYACYFNKHLLILRFGGSFLHNKN